MPEVLERRADPGLDVARSRGSGRAGRPIQERAADLGRRDPAVLPLPSCLSRPIRPSAMMTGTSTTSGVKPWLQASRMCSTEFERWPT